MRLATLVASRFVLNAVFRISYPLIPFVVLRFGVADEQATWIVTVAVLLGLASPLGGWLGDRFGYRAIMLLGLALVGSGTLLATVTPSFGLLIAAFALSGLGTALYQPAMQAYVSALTPYHARGRAVGLVELSWALAGIAAVPPLTRLVELRGDFDIVFLILSIALGLAMLGTLLLLPSEHHSVTHAAARREPTGVLRERSVLGLLLFVFLAVGGVELLYIVQPVWATRTFDASLSALGFASFIFGIGELGGSAASAALTDRLGKLRAATLGFAVAAATFMLLPLISVSWLSYLVAYFLMAICVEFAIVASLTLASTVRVVGRGTIMALTVTALQVGRAIASQLGLPLLNASSLALTAVIAAALTLAGVLAALRFVREGERQFVHDAV